MRPKSHRWLSMLIGRLKPVYSSFFQGQGGLEGQRTPYPRYKAGLGTGGGLYPSDHTASWNSLTSCGQTSPGGGKHILPGPAHSGKTSGFGDMVRNPCMALQARWTATSSSPSYRSRVTPVTHSEASKRCLERRDSGGSAGHSTS